jgi:PAS domain S-box-containing protein
VCVGPGQEVGDRGFIAGAAEEQGRVVAMDRARELHIERAVVLGGGVLAVGLLAELHSGDRHPQRTQVAARGGDDGEAASAYASGAVDFMFTPVPPDVLRAKVSAFVDLFLQSHELERSLESITALNAALRDSDMRTQAVLDNVSDAIFILDEEGLVESVNRSVGRLFGYHAGEPVGHPFAFMIAPECRDDVRSLNTVWALAERGAPIRATETLGCRQDGTTFPIELERGEMKHGDLRLTLASVRDISERRAHAQALEELDCPVASCPRRHARTRSRP